MLFLPFILFSYELPSSLLKVLYLYMKFFSSIIVIKGDAVKALILRGTAESIRPYNPYF